MLLRDNHVSWSGLNEICPVMVEQECSSAHRSTLPKSWLHSTLSALHTKLPLFSLVLKSNAPSLPFSLPLCCPASLFSLPVYLFWPFHQLSPYLNVLHSLACFSISLRLKYVRMLGFFHCFYFSSFPVCLVQLFPLSFIDFCVVYSAEGKIQPKKKSVLSCIFTTLTGGWGGRFQATLFLLNSYFRLTAYLISWNGEGGDCALVLLSYFFKA